MKHVILGFIVLILIPLVSWWWSHSLGRGLVVVLLAAAFGQIFIGVSKLGRQGVQLSDAQDTSVLVIAFLLTIFGIFWIF